MAVINVSDEQLLTIKGALQEMSNFYYDEMKRHEPGGEEHQIVLEEFDKVEELLRHIFDAVPIELAA